MLEMPCRSVTRFFIPLIDVLILLFCIFLMMPAVKRTAEAEVGATAPSQEKQAELERREQAVQQKEQQLAPAWINCAARRRERCCLNYGRACLISAHPMASSIIAILIRSR